ncbi:unnamed protein product [Rhizoctonia solani]|uniref:Kex protein n=1 Tax=Rhizoctonia solani TaxID=456999 RepID=A0A8H3D272_9AGAM|nr:unnamed protein product [Rhizoctonia solani]
MAVLDILSAVDYWVLRDRVLRVDGGALSPTPGRYILHIHATLASVLDMGGGQQCIHDLGALEWHGKLTAAVVALELARYGLYSYIGARHNPKAIILGITIPLAGLCSLNLLAIHFWPVFTLRSRFPMGSLLKTNTKDVFVVAHTPMVLPQNLSILGSSRNIATPLPPPGKVYGVFSSLWNICNVGRRVVVFFTHLFFRRVSPVESRMYAFCRNTFAVAAICVLAFRAATALQQAQNRVGTRTTSADYVGRTSPIHTIGILMEHRYDPYVGIDVTTFGDRTWDQPIYDVTNSTDTQNCARAFLVPPQRSPPNQTLELWTCSNLSEVISKSSNYNSQSDAFVDGIHIVDKHPILRSELKPNHLPLVWLLNLAEHPTSLNFSAVDDVRTYLPPWKFRRGLHVEAEAKLITRRFIISSIMKDMFLSAEPSYRPLSLYPIFESSTNTLNLNTSQPWVMRFSRATATVRTSLNPGLMYFRSQASQRPLNSTIGAETCDFIEDYRSGTIFDVVGSVGGLFALLTAAHVLLFGRPLFWGLTGAKLITPFGLLGACTSRGFKRRLKDHYHIHSPEDGSDTIRIGAFLRDFVMDFGPAEIDIEHRPMQKLTGSPLTLMGNDQDAAGMRVPLMQMGSNEIIPENSNYIELPVDSP